MKPGNDLTVAGLCLSGGGVDLAGHREPRPADRARWPARRGKSDRRQAMGDETEV